ncbi:uncharacterized protein LOC127137782 [Lathyrus oleraceus]|uniref:uncharacterized protein LOC127137782 n=1 Tax=Pisum sativum TaxID=3888 RepID=UPI0021D28F67|nr:uncharacterized protein LOC127137782 [Pisum sativum]
MNILDIVNSSNASGEKMSDEKLVRKILGSMPKKFDMKVTTIDEAQDIYNMKVKELIGSLQTFELVISDRSEKKNKIITFISNSDDEEAQFDMEIDEGISNAIVLLGRQFHKCHGCEGFCHIISECPTFTNRYESEGEPDDEMIKHVTTFTNRYESDEDSYDEDVSYEELTKSYRELLYGYPKYSTYPMANHVMIKTRKEWKPKSVDTCLIAYTSFRDSSREDWYFDSGCSRHRTGVKKYLMDIKFYSTNFVTFGDRGKGEIKGIGKEYEVKLWHQKLGHLKLKGMKKIMFKEAIRDLPKLKIVEGKVCGKFCQRKIRHFEVFKDLCQHLQREKKNVIVRIRSDHGKEFENAKFSEFSSSEGIDVDEDVGTSSQQTDASENMEDIESNIDPTRTESDNP